MLEAKIPSRRYTISNSKPPKSTTQNDADSLKFSRFLAAMIHSIFAWHIQAQAESLPSPPVSPTSFAIPSASHTTYSELKINAADKDPSLVRVIHHILKATGSVLSLPMIVIALKLVQRLITHVGRLPAKGSEPHLFCASIMVAQKFCDDHAFRNRTWARMTRLPIQVVSQMEREFLEGVRYDLHVGKDEYHDWFALVQEQAKRWESHQNIAVLPFVRPSFPPYRPGEQQQVKSVLHQPQYQTRPLPVARYHPFQRRHDTVETRRVPHPVNYNRNYIVYSSNTLCPRYQYEPAAMNYQGMSTRKYPVTLTAPFSYPPTEMQSRSRAPVPSQTCQSHTSTAVSYEQRHQHQRVPKTSTLSHRRTLSA